MCKTTIKRSHSLGESLNDVKYEQYVNNLHDRLPQLMDPSDIDCQRWPWELLQNAKDTVFKRERPEERYVDVTIKYYIDGEGKKKLYFEHNGDQFTNKAITGLIWKFSAEKRNEQTTEDGLTRDKQSTGRFGTGFMTTHALSLTVDVSGSLFHDDPDIMRNVSVDFTLHREGPDDKAYKDGVNATEREIDENMDRRPIPIGEILPTRFTYHIDKEASEKAARMGIENVRANGAQTMLFCPSVRSIKVIDEVNNRTFTIERQNNDERKNVVKEVIFIENSSDKGAPITRRFISTEIEEYSESISSHWKAKNRNLRLNVAVEVDKDNNILAIPSTSPAVYCSLPLIGFERMSLPFYINSNDFEPATERTSLYLKKKKFEKRTNEDTGVEETFYLQSGINWSIFERSIPLYEQIVDYLIEHDYNQRYNLVNGLNDILKGAWGLETKNCLASRLILPLRNMLAGKNLVKTGEGYRSIKSEVKFVECTKECDLHTLYNICETIYGTNLAIEEENEKWVSLKWGRFKFDEDFEEKTPEGENPAFPTIKYDKIAEFIENAGSIDNLQLILPDDNELLCNMKEECNTLVKTQKLEWLNKFYEWIENSKITNLSEKKMVPNRLGKFCSTEHGCDLRDASDISIDIFDFMKQIEIDWDNTLLMEGVRHITLTKEPKENIITAIIKRVKDVCDNSYDNNDNKLTKILPILLALPSNENGRIEEFLNKRMNIISILKTMYSSQCEGKNLVTLDLKADTWEYADKWFMSIVASTLANRKHLDVIVDDDNEEDRKAKYCTGGWLSETLNFMFQKSYLHQEDITSKEDKKNTLALIPNRYGDFRPINELHTQGQIPNELLSDDLNKTGYDVKEILLYRDFTLNDKISITELTVADIAAKYNEFFDSENEDNKKVVANYLIHLIPECGDMLGEIRKLYEEYYKIERSTTIISTSDLNIWKGAKNFLISLLAKNVSECGHIFDLGKYLYGYLDSQILTHEQKEDCRKTGMFWLNRLAEAIKTNKSTIDENFKMIPDYYGELHADKDMIYNGSILNNYERIQSLVEIIDGDLWAYFDNDSKNDGDDNIIHSIVNASYIFVKDYQRNTDEKVFNVVDRLISYCHKNNNTSWRIKLKNAIESLLRFFDANDSVNSEHKWINFFHNTYSVRKELYYDYICDAATKVRISRISDNFTPDEIEKLINEKETVKDILAKKDYYANLEEENQRLSDKVEQLSDLSDIIKECPTDQLNNVKELVERLVVMDDNTSRKIIELVQCDKTQISAIQEILNNFPSLDFNGILMELKQEQGDFNVMRVQQNISDERKKEIGDKGECFVYELLCNRFNKSNVKWSNYAPTDNGARKVLFKGKEYNLITTTHDFDFVVSHNDKTVYIEVKTTVGGINNCKDFPLIFESKEWEWIDNVKDKDSLHYIVRVFDIEGCPKAYFLKQTLSVE